MIAAYLNVTAITVALLMAWLIMGLVLGIANY